jgi:hypothetical protein
VDGVNFKAHRKNLSVHSTIFADADAISGMTTEPEVVILPETADVLGLLLEFMYRQPQPQFDSKIFATIADLAKAAEKYEVIAAIHRCEKALKCVQFWQQRYAHAFLPLGWSAEKPWQKSRISAELCKFWPMQQSMMT